MDQIKRIIDLLKLVPLAGEGGYFRETYRSTQVCHNRPLSGENRPEKETGAGLGLVVSTAIYYLITGESWSALHRIPSDEIFHFYAGSPVTMLQICEESGGQARVITIGNDLERGHQPQVVAPKGVWQGTRLADVDVNGELGGDEGDGEHGDGSSKWALLGTTVAPGFEFSHLEIANDEAMGRFLQQFPEHERLIRLLEPKE